MAQFPSTQWSLIRRSGSPSSRHVAFAELALSYRETILAFFRSRLEGSAAEDATQSFLAASFEHDWWSRAQVESGSFRGFLLLLLRRHLGHVRTTPIAESHIEAEFVDPAPPVDRHFDARFALALALLAPAEPAMRKRSGGSWLLVRYLTTLADAHVGQREFQAAEKR